MMPALTANLSYLRPSRSRPGVIAPRPRVAVLLHDHSHDAIPEDLRYYPIGRAANDCFGVP
jgi:hypothetical protein